MNEATKDFILLCIVGYMIWVLLITLWFRFVNWWERRFSKKHKRYYPDKYPNRTFTTDDIIGSPVRMHKQSEQNNKHENNNINVRRKRGKNGRKKKRCGLKSLHWKWQKRWFRKRCDYNNRHHPKSLLSSIRVIPVEELDAVFANEEVLSNYSMPDKFDRMMVAESATTMDELKSVAEVLKNKEATTGEQQREAVRVIAKIDNTLLLEQMLSQIDGATKYASELIEKHYTEQLTPYPKPQMVNFDMEKYLNY